MKVRELLKLIESDGWYPAIDVNVARDVMRIGTVITDARLRTAIIGALIAVGRELASWRAAQEALGFISFEDVPAAQIDFESAHIGAWRRAVWHMTMADLAETHRDIGTTANGGPRADAQALSADEYRRTATHAIRDILGLTRTTVALI